MPDAPSTPSDARLGPGLAFLRRLWRLDHALERLSGRMERRLGVTAPQRLVLRCVGKFPGLSAGQLAALLHLDPSTISSALRRLEQRNLLERTRDPDDARRVVLQLTTAGRSVARATAGTVEHAVEQMMAEVAPDELDRFEALLERLCDTVEAEAPERDGRAPRATARSGSATRPASRTAPRTRATRRSAAPRR